MKFSLLPKAKIRDNDTAAMRAAITLLTSMGVDVRRPAKSNFQLKLDEITNFYPGKGTVFIDGDACPWPETGDAALQKWLAERGRENA
jgi:hypothetical protein